MKYKLGIPSFPTDPEQAAAWRKTLSKMLSKHLDTVSEDQLTSLVPSLNFYYGLTALTKDQLLEKGIISVSNVVLNGSGQSDQYLDQSSEEIELTEADFISEEFEEGAPIFHPNSFRPKITKNIPPLIA